MHGGLDVESVGRKGVNELWLQNAQIAQVAQIAGCMR